MAYAAESDIKLGQIPALDPADVRLLPILQPIHNAIHALNANTVGIKDYLAVPKIDSPPEAGFLNKIPSFWAECAPDVIEGKIVYPKEGSGHWAKGAQGFHYKGVNSAGAEVNSKETWPFGFTAEAPIEGKCRILWPPFLISIPDVQVGDIGQRIYTDGHGDLFIPLKRKNEDWAVGVIVGEGIVVIDAGMRW